VCQLIGKDGRVIRGGKVATAPTPYGEGVDNTLDELPRREFALGCTQRAAEVFRGHHIGSHLRPELWKVNVTLLKHHGTIFAGDQGMACFPVHFVVWADTSTREVTLQRETSRLSLGVFSMSVDGPRRRDASVYSGMPIHGAPPLFPETRDLLQTAIGLLQVAIHSNASTIPGVKESFNKKNAICIKNLLTF
jgi:hypothetical protein